MATPTDTAPDQRIGCLRLGVVRARGASLDPTVASAEARVVQAELERRLGPVSLDLRTEGQPSGPWLPRQLAAWPADIDATVELSGLGDRAPNLVALFSRTVDPTAADVRMRMLEHLDVLPVGDEPLTDARLDALLPPPARPTDLWLVARSASSLATNEPAHDALRLDADDAIVRELDGWFDDAVTNLGGASPDTEVARLRAEITQLRARLATANDDAIRTERLALDRLTDIEAERDSLRERLERAMLDRGIADPTTA